MPEAPPLSTATPDCLNAAESASAMTRPMPSVPPPGEEAMSRRIGLLGYGCACATAATAMSVAAATQRNIRSAAGKESGPRWLRRPSCSVSRSRRDDRRVLRPVLAGAEAACTFGDEEDLLLRLRLRLVQPPGAVASGSGPGVCVGEAT